jgi:hypothetical protein
MARALGKRLYSHSDNDRERLNYGFDLCFSRPAETYELERLEKYLAQQTQVYAESPEDVRQLVGEVTAEGPAEAAAWIATARVLLNLDEFITRE